VNSAISPQPARKRPIDRVAWIVWIVLFVGISLGAYALRQLGSSQAVVWVAAKDLPAYHLIVDTEVISTTVTSSALPGDALSVDTSPLGIYTRKPISANQVLQHAGLIIPNDPALTLDTAPVSIPASAAMTFNRELSSGTLVTVWAVFPTEDPGVNRTELLFPQVLVLDVGPIEPGEDAQTHPYVVILAVPVSHQAEVLAAAASGSLTFTLVP
jgi:Flp pilus assembly protein CpaB